MSEELSPAIPADIEAAIMRVLERACAREMRIATAESCTGGLLSSLLTDVEGCSHAFDRGFVVYSDQAKCDLLHIPRSTVERFGAVSREVAVAMAQGALKASEADIALSITGFAGRGGNGDEPGLVHFACARDGADAVHREAHFGDIGRGPVRIECIRTALDMIEKALS